MKRLLRALAALLVGLAFLVPAAGSAQAATPYCGIRWGSLSKAAGTDVGAEYLTDVRTGRHACFDRLVLDVRGDVSGYHVAYTDQVRGVGSGDVIPVRGGARLAVVAYVHGSDTQGRASYTPPSFSNLTDVTGYSTFRQVAWGGSFEGHTVIGLGVRARLPFRVFVLDGPGAGSRLVVDVAHRW